MPWLAQGVLVMIENRTGWLAACVQSMGMTCAPTPITAHRPGSVVVAVATTALRCSDQSSVSQLGLWPQTSETGPAGIRLLLRASARRYGLWAVMGVRL
jgi:hypothetical protein